MAAVVVVRHYRIAPRRPDSSDQFGCVLWSTSNGLFEARRRATRQSAPPRGWFPGWEAGRHRRRSPSQQAGGCRWVPRLDRPSRAQACSRL